MLVPVPRLCRAVVCLLLVLGVGSAATSWEDRDDAIAARDEIALVSAAPAPAGAHAARAAIDAHAAPITRPAIAIPRVAIIAPPSASPLLSLAPKTSPPRC